MRRPAFVISLLVATAACNRQAFRWQPSLVSQVPDGAPVRFGVEQGRPRMSGRSLGWQALTPRVVTARGDTLTVPTGALTEVRLKNKTNHALIGAIFGYVVGFGVAYANCPSSSQGCSDQSLTPHLIASAGALIGSMFKTDHWVRVRWDTDKQG